MLTKEVWGPSIDSMHSTIWILYNTMQIDFSSNDDSVSGSRLAFIRMTRVLEASLQGSHLLAQPQRHNILFLKLTLTLTLTPLLILCLTLL